MKSIIAKIVLGIMPTPLASRIINLAPRFSYLASNKDFSISLTNVMYDNIRLYLNPIYKIEKLLMYNHSYDVKTTSYIFNYVKPGDICLDIGANMGSMSFPMAICAGETGAVYAFEPGPILFQRLDSNIRRNKHRSLEIRPIQLGLSNREGQLYWMMDTENHGNAYLSATETSDCSVDVSTVDLQCEKLNISRVDFIKIDVEGMEFEVLQGSIKTLKNHKPTIVFETWIQDDHAKKIPRSLEILENYGYSFFESDVKEADLASTNYIIGLIPTKYPRLPSNTVAVHPSRFKVLGLQL